MYPILALKASWAGIIADYNLRRWRHLKMGLHLKSVKSPTLSNKAVLS
jgi:hypothetical protein